MRTPVHSPGCFGANSAHLLIYLYGMVAMPVIMNLSWRYSAVALATLIIIVVHAYDVSMALSTAVKISLNTVRTNITNRTSSHTHQLAQLSHRARNTSYTAPINNGPDTNSREIIPPWMWDHIKFQQKWIIKGKQQAGDANDEGQISTGTSYRIMPTDKNTSNQTRPNLLVWNCQAQGGCGGLGDRLYGIIMGLYMAMMTQRIFLIQEWKQPNIAHPLWDYVQPNHLAWHAQLDSKTRQEMGLLSTIDNRDHPLLMDPCDRQLELADKRDYYLRNNIMTYETQLDQSFCLQNYWKEHGGRTDNAPLPNTGFLTLFQFTQRVQEQAHNLLRQSRILNRRRQSTATATTMPMYIAMHVRTGQGKTWDDPDRHAGLSDLERFDACAVRVQTAIGQKCATQLDVYVASDKSQAKVYFLDKHSHDGTFKANVIMEVFHIDRTNAELLSNVLGAYDQVWGELKVLIDAACLIMSRSNFSILGLDLSPQQPRCAVYFDECDENHVRRAVEALVC